MIILWKGEMELEGTVLPSNGDTSCINVRRIRQAKGSSLRKLALPLIG